MIVGNFPSLLVHLLLHTESLFPQNVSLHFLSSTQPLISKSHWLLHRRLRRLVWIARWLHTADKVLQNYSRVRKGAERGLLGNQELPVLQNYSRIRKGAERGLLGNQELPRVKSLTSYTPDSDPSSTPHPLKVMLLSASGSPQRIVSDNKSSCPDPGNGGTLL